MLLTVSLWVYFILPHSRLHILLPTLPTPTPYPLPPTYYCYYKFFPPHVPIKKVHYKLLRPNFGTNPCLPGLTDPSPLSCILRGSLVPVSMECLASSSRASYAPPNMKTLLVKGWWSSRTTHNTSSPSPTVIHCITCNFMWFDTNKISWWARDQRYIHSISHLCRKEMQSNFVWVLNLVVSYLDGRIWSTEVIWFLQNLTAIFKCIGGLKWLGFISITDGIHLGILWSGTMLDHRTLISN